MTAIAPSNSRGMGWRKPVPVFIPTPPSSRPTSGTSFTPPSGNADKRPAVEDPEDILPPMPENWLSVVRSASQDFYRDGSRFYRPGRAAFPERQPVYAEFSRTASLTDSHASRSHYSPKGAFPKSFRPPTPPIPSVRRPRSIAVPGMLEQQTSLGRPYRMIYPDPPTLAMKTSLQTLRHSPTPSLCKCESTRKPTSVKTRPSLQSLSSEGHTAVSSHADMGSWFNNDILQAELNLRLALDGQNEKRLIDVGKETNRKSELPMHYIPASRLKKVRKRRSCSDMLWSAMVTAGRTITSVFKTYPAESGRTHLG